MHRRKFLKLSTLGAVAVSLPFAGYYAGTPTKNAAVGLILKEFQYLKIERKEVELFIEAYFKTFVQTPFYMAKISFCHLSGISPAQFESTAPLLEAFLRSTDFFRNGMNENKEIKYVGLYDPYKIPCGNPFSFFYYSSRV